MTHSSNSSDIEPIYQLLTSYSFDAETYQVKAVIAGWLAEFGPVWVSHAITEALYQGRYKLISIEQILKLWQRRGQPIRHFNREFETIILGQTLLCPTGYGDGAEWPTIRRVTPPALATPPQAPQAAAPEAIPEAVPEAAPEAAPEPSTELAPEAADPVLAPTEAPAADDAGSNEQDAARSPESEAGEPNVVAEPAIAPPDPPALPNFRPLAPNEDSLGQSVEVIQPFVPRRGESELHERLRAVVQGGMRE
ncbi:MAG TPA: hypothetical protein VEZ50_00600 [Nodosilinea sp.]|nr:hypothetical protein [Nodosilinea sp.]